MSNLNGIDYGLPSVDDLFSTQEERDDAKLKKLHDIPVSLIDEFPEHPYQVRDAQTIKMRNMQQEGKLTDEVISCIMQEDKPNQKEKFVIKDDRAMNILKKYPIPNRAQIVGDALEAWDRQKAQEQHQEHHDWER